MDVPSVAPVRYGRVDFEFQVVDLKLRNKTVLGFGFSIFGRAGEYRAYALSATSSASTTDAFVAIY